MHRTSYDKFHELIERSVCTLAENQKSDTLPTEKFIPTYLDRENSAQLVLNSRTKSRNIRSSHWSSVIYGGSKIYYFPRVSSLSLSLSWLHDFRTLSILSKDRKSLDSCWTLGFHTFIRRSPSRGPRKYLAHESKTEIVHLADEITGTY